MKRLLLTILVGCTTPTETTTLTTAPDAPQLTVRASGPDVCMAAREYQREITWKAAIRAWVLSAEAELGIAP